MKKLPIIALFIVTILSSCSSIQVTSDYDKNVDFSKFTTYSFYGWTKNSDKILNSLDKERIENSFKQEFDSRGLKYVNDGGELTVSLFIVSEEKTEQVANTTNVGGYYGYGYGGYYGYGPAWGWGAPMGNSITTVSNVNYTVGTLIVDVFDTQNKKLIWEGIGKKTIDRDPSNRDQSIPNSVSAIMAQYPVKPIKTK